MQIATTQPASPNSHQTVSSQPKSKVKSSSFHSFPGHKRFSPFSRPFLQYHHRAIVFVAPPVAQTTNSQRAGWRAKKEAECGTAMNAILFIASIRSHLHGS
jgi:hypothetical protein